MSPPRRRDKEYVLSWFLEAHRDDVKWVLVKSFYKHEQLLEEVLHDPVLPVSNSPASSNLGRVELSDRSERLQTDIRQIDLRGTSPDPRKTDLRTASNGTSPPDDDDGSLRRKDTVDFDSLLSQCVDSPPERKLQAVTRREAADFQISNTELPIVQFSAPMYFCRLDEEHVVSLDVIRIGNLTKRSEISFTTKNGSAHAGVKYSAHKGRVVFEAGSSTEVISVNLLPSNVFDTTTEFQVELLEGPEAPVHCQAGRYLYVARVKVIDGNCFPSNKYAKQIRAGEVEKIPFWGLLIEYVKFNLESSVTRRGVIKSVLVDVIKSCYVLLKLLCNLYLVDKILGKKKPEMAEIHLVMIAVFVTVPFFLIHFLDFRKTTWKVGGSSRGKLQSFLLRKFLNYSQEVRQKLSSADLIMAVTRDVTETVHDGFMKVLSLLSSVMNLLAVLIFQVAVLILPFFDVAFKPIGFAVFGLFPAVLLAILFLRHKVTTKYISAENHGEVELVAQAERIMTLYPLIADFGQRPFFEARFEKRVSEYNTARKFANQVTLNNKYFSPWLTVLCVSAYIVYGGMQKLDGTLTLGLFLANVSIINTIGTSAGTIYQLLMEIEASSPSLYKITDLINLPTDLRARQALNRSKRQKTATMRAELLKTLSRGWPADSLPIEIEGLKFSYPAGPAFSVHAESKIQFFQGELTALVGPEGEGKSTLLYMLGGVVLPDPGSVFVPSHLRVLHVSPIALFFKGTLFENLTFGCLGPEDPDSRVERVMSICRRLLFPEDILHMIGEGHKGPVLVWQEVLAHSHKSLLQFARAIITNPELMCVHKPVMYIGDKSSAVVLELLREFCVQKGVGQNDKTRQHRRPRTCILTAAKIAAVQEADRIYLVSRKAGIKYIPKEFALKSVGS